MLSEWELRASHSLCYCGLPVFMNAELFAMLRLPWSGSADHATILLEAVFARSFGASPLEEEFGRVARASLRIEY